ncbi:unnamed protein product [Paramecium pentaurelia]|uniref:Transmembrane protein n=1 Tax=Paramecium pentaurelia TaxID=43138 RepID=A0A8S1ULU1_9CILI|nr:unnamed protein product [Paramecium pentaurelia]
MCIKQIQILIIIYKCLYNVYSNYKVISLKLHKETFSLYNILFLILQCIIKFQNAASNIIDKEATNEIHIYILFRNFNEKIYLSFSWLNFATMIPAIFMLLLITICTCQIKLFQSLIKRNIRYQEDEIFDEYNGEEGFECSICMEELKQMEKYVELATLQSYL